MNREKIAGAVWHIDPKYRDHFFSQEGLRLPEWLARGQATVVKKGPHRTVYRVELPEVTYYLKHNLIPDVRARLRQLVRPGKAWTECRKALAVAARGVATFEPLAVGTLVSGRNLGESYLISRSLEGARQLDHYIEETFTASRNSDSARRRIRLAMALGRFSAKLHTAGIFHHDLHCGNILIRWQRDDEPELFLVDLQAVRLGRPLGWPRSRENLVMLNRWLFVRASRADRLRFWRAYFQARTESFWQRERVLPIESSRSDRAVRLCLREKARTLEEATRKSNERFWARRDLRYLQTNRRICRFNSSNISGYASTDLDADFLQSLIDDPDGPFRRQDAVWLKNSRSAKVIELTASVNGSGNTVIYKRFETKQSSDPLANLFRLSPALRSWLLGHGMRERWLPTARPLAVLCVRRWGLSFQGYLLMEKVDSAGDLHHALETLDSSPTLHKRSQLHHWIDELARLVREMHDRHLAHRDLKAANILLLESADKTQSEQTSDNGAPSVQELRSSFCFVDLVGVSRHRRVSRRLRMKNLARLHASFVSDDRLTRTDKLRFLRAYLQWGLFGKGGWKDWWRGIDSATLRKIEKNLRSGRPLN